MVCSMLANAITVYNSLEKKNSNFFIHRLFKNVSVSKKGISVFVSQPHFLNAEEKFLNSVEGLEPSIDKHCSFAQYEPVNEA